MNARHDRAVHGLAERLVDGLRREVLHSPGDRAALRRMLGHPPTHPSARPAHGVVYNCLRGQKGQRPLELPDDPVQEWALYAVAAMIAAQPRDARDEHTAVAPSRADAPDIDADTEADGGQMGLFDPEEVDPAQHPAPDGADAADPESDTALTQRYRRFNLGASLAEGVKAGNLKADSSEARLHRLCRLDLASLHKRLPTVVRHIRSREVAVDWVVLAEDLARWSGERDQVAKQWLQSYHRARNLHLYEEEKKKRQAEKKAASSQDEEQ